jgi:hypothetical protein
MHGPAELRLDEIDNPRARPSDCVVRIAVASDPEQATDVLFEHP